MSKHSGLGRGLDSLLSSSESQYEDAMPEKRSAGEGAVEIPVSRIKSNPWQPRKTFDKEKLEELADSIKKHGIIQPLIVRKKGINYELVAGERRLRAAKLAKLDAVPVLIRQYDEAQMRELALVENIQRHDLNPLEEAKAIQELMRQYDYTQAQAAERVGRSRATVTNLLRMLHLPKELQILVAEEKVTAGQLRPVLALSKKEQQLQVGRAMLEHNWSARTVEAVVKALKEGKEMRVLEAKVQVKDRNENTETKEKKDGKSVGNRIRAEVSDVHYKQFEEDLINFLGTKVRIAAKNDHVGKIEIEYYSLEDLNRIYELLYNKKGIAVKDAGPWLNPKFTV